MLPPSKLAPFSHPVISVRLIVKLLLPIAVVAVRLAGDRPVDDLAVLDDQPGAVVVDHPHRVAADPGVADRDVRGVHDDLAGDVRALITVPAVVIVRLPLGVSVVPAGTPVHEASGYAGSGQLCG